MDPINSERRIEPQVAPEPVAPPPPPSPPPAEPAATGYDAVVRDGFDPAKADGMPAIAANPANGGYGALSAEDKTRYDELQKAGGPAAGNARELLQSGQFGDYSKVEKAIEVHGAPLEKDDLRRALGAGTLNKDGVLSTMASLTQGGETKLGYQRWQLMDQLAQDLGRPDELLQKGNNKDCAGLSAEYVLSKSNPSAYVKAVVGLAETGSTDLGGARLQAPSPDKGDPRSTTERLFAASFVAAVNGKSGFAAGSIPGVDGLQLSKGLGQITGQSWQALFLAQPQKGQGTDAQAAGTQAAAQQAITEQLAGGKPALANLDGHWVVINGISGKDGSAEVKYLDNYGGKMTWKLDDFVKHLDSVVFDPSLSKPATLGDASWRDPGGGGSAGAGSNGGND